MRVWFGAAVLLAALPAQAETYRCVIDGVPAYSDKRLCEDATPYRPGDSLSSMGSTGEYDDLSVRYQQRIAREKAEATQSRRAADRRFAERKAERQRLQAARRAGMPAEGMSESRVETMYGRPSRVSTSGACKDLYWRDPYRHVTTCDGKVSYSYKVTD